MAVNCVQATVIAYIFLKQIESISEVGAHFLQGASGRRIAPFLPRLRSTHETRAPTGLDTTGEGFRLCL